MKRRTRYILLSIPVTVLLALFIAAGWLFGTTRGAQWLLDEVNRSTPLTIEAKAVEGRLCTELRLQGLRLSWPKGTAMIKEFKVGLQPDLLLIGRIKINKLVVEGAEVLDTRPEMPAPPGLNWPTMSRTIYYLNVRIQNLSVDNFIYRRLDKMPVAIPRLSADIHLLRGIVTARKIVFAMPQFRIEGKLAIGLSEPYLRTEMTLIPAAPFAEMDRFDVNMALLPVKTPAIAEGTIKIAGLSKAATLVQIESKISMTNDILRLSNVHMFRPDRSGDIRGEAEAVFTEEQPTVHAKLILANVDLSQEFPPVSNLSGTVTIDGSMDEYQGALSLFNKGAGWRTGRIDAMFHGTSNAIKVTSIKGNLLDGTINGRAEAAWKEGLSGTASLKIRDMNPGVVAPDWSGRINMDLHGAVRSSIKKQVEGELSLHLLKSRVRNRPVTGQVEARIKQENLRLDRLVFRGKGFDVKASGDLAKRVSIAVSLSDLSLFVPTAKGNVGIDGWVRLRKDSLAGSVTAHARKFVMNGAKAASETLSGRLEDLKGPFTAELSIQDGAYNILHADSVNVYASGTIEKHTIRASLQSSSVYKIAARLTGNYSAGAWQGKIDRFSGSDPMGPWRAHEPAFLMVSADGFSLSPLVISGPGSEKIELRGKIAKNPLSGSIYVDWHELNISRANAWLVGVRVSGFSTGRITGNIMPEERFDIAGNVSLSQASVRRLIRNVELKAKINKADLSVMWDGDAIEGKLSLVLAEYGRIDAGLYAPVPARLPVSFNQDSPFRVSIKGKLREAGALSFLFPGLVQESRGQIDMDVHADGTWRDPRLNGSLLLDKAGGYFPANGIRMTDIRVEARIEQDRVHIDSLKARSGPGAIEGKAIVTLEGWNIAGYEGTLQGERFQAMFLPQMRMLISPRIEFKGTLQKLYARGEVRVPELLVYGPPTEAPVQPSEDVVIIGDLNDVEKAGRFATDVEIKVILGERVIVKAEGVDANLGGEVLLTLRSTRDVTGKGEIKVTKGKYSAYGVSLNITRGRIFFAGPIENPTLDILAIRKLTDVSAGVLISGTLQKPVINLYSEPAMPDADVLAYMVLGHPLGQDTEQADYLMKAAGALLSASQSVALQDKVKQRLGLDTIDVESGGGEISRSLVTFGKYLSSRLYVSYGRSLFTGENIYRLRYRFAKRWEFESRSGETSGVDLYYTIQFD